jgi:hypothetical protein
MVVSEEAKPAATVVHSKPALDGELVLVTALSFLFTLPLWLSTHPPMADYPQHLSMASVLRWYHDPSRHLVETYSLALTRPNTAFAFLTVALSYIMSIGLAGKLVVAASVAATGLAGLALARRAGRPWWFGLFALLSAYNFAFFFGFVNNVIATPLFLYGVVLADRKLDRAIAWRPWLGLATVGFAFYFVHIQFLFLFVASVGWLALTRRTSWRSWLGISSSQIPAVTITLLYYFLRHEETYGYHEKNIFADVHGSTLIFDKLVEIPQYLFGTLEDGKHWLLLAMAVLPALLLYKARQAVPAPSQAPVAETRPAMVKAFLERTRFVTLALWFVVAYLLLPHIFVGAFIYQRLIAVAWLMLPAALPRPDVCKARPGKIVLVGALALQLVVLSDAALTFNLEARGGHALMAKTAPGKNFMGVMLWLGSAVVQYPPLLVHFGAHYLAEKGGRVYFSFSELHISAVQLHPQLAFEDQDSMMNEWQPLSFRFSDFGYHWDYVLCHGDFSRLQRIFGHHLAKLAWASQDDWILFWRKSHPELAPQNRP